MDSSYLFEKAAQVCESAFRPKVPFDTGNMRYNATQIRRISSNTIVLKVDARIAPYVVYTNEPWVSPKWKGRENPNEGWFEKATEEFARKLAISLQGTLKKG